MRFLTCVAALVLVAPLLAAEKKAAEKNKRAPATGVICVAPFHVQPEDANGPNMSDTTWAPGADSKFVFRIGKTVKATVANHQMVTIGDVPADRKVLVGIRLDGRPFESFYVDLRKEENHRTCLWLYKGYWHWVNMGWGDEVKGCRCESGSK
jgi:hypothetical protein